MASGWCDRAQKAWKWLLCCPIDRLCFAAGMNPCVTAGRHKGIVRIIPSSLRILLERQSEPSSPSNSSSFQPLFLWLKWPLPPSIFFCLCTRIRCRASPPPRGESSICTPESVYASGVQIIFHLLHHYLYTYTPTPQSIICTPTPILLELHSTTERLLNAFLSKCLCEFR